MWHALAIGSFALANACHQSEAGTDARDPEFEQFRVGLPRDAETGVYIVERDVAIRGIEALHAYYGE